MRGWMVRRLGGAAALLLALGLAGAGAASDPASGPGHLDSELPVGMTYEVHVKQVFHGTVRLKHRDWVERRPETTRLTESYRVTVLAVKGGRPSQVEINYLGAEATPRVYRLEKRAAGHTYVVTARPGDKAATVTEHGDGVDALMGRKVRGDALVVLAPEALDRVVSRGLRSPGHAVDVPPKLINAALGAAGPQVISAHLQLVRVNGGRALFMLREHDRWTVGAVVIDGQVSGPEVIDATNGRNQWARISGTLDGHGLYLTGHGRVRARVTGHYSVSVQFDYLVR